LKAQRINSGMKGFKTFQSSSEAAATEALEDLNIDDGQTSDEYDLSHSIARNNPQAGDIEGET
jgi:DNA replication licensing factor MCM7